MPIALGLIDTGASQSVNQRSSPAGMSRPRFRAGSRHSLPGSFSVRRDELERKNFTGTGEKVDIPPSQLSIG